MTGNGKTRVVITGLGAISPLGQSVDEYWGNLVAGRSGAGPMTLCDTEGFSSRIACEVKDWDPTRFIDRREARRMARFSQMAVAAAREALDDAGLDLAHEDTTRIGVVLGNGNGGYPEIEEASRVVMTKGGMKLDPLFVARTIPNMAASQISLQFGLRGYNGTIVTACAAATQAIGEALHMLRAGRADVLVTGGAEAGISQLGLGGFAVMRALSARNDDPERASRPFDKDRDGFVPAEGAGVLVLETEEHARARGGRIYAEVAGSGVTADAFHVVAPPEDGDGARRAMLEALSDAGISQDEVDYINAHGTSTPLNDAIETVAIKAAFGEAAYQIPISSTKSMIGHALGASGGLETIACVKTIQTGVIHPTINYETADPACDLDYVPNESRKAEVRTVLKNSFGFGGQNACLVLRRYENGAGS
jgi:3-oxoacyl-[acyl-carrier-protein] synthase II